MTTLEPTIAEQAESPNGDIFLSKIRRGESVDLTRRETADIIVNCLGELLDLSNVGSVVDEVRSQVAALASMASSPEGLASELRRLALENTVAELNDILKAHTGVWAITYIEPPTAPSTRLQALVDSYGFAHIEGEQTALFLPHHEITGIDVLPYNNSGNLYQPAMNLRIRTDQDRPTQYFGEDGCIKDRPSSGGWYKFDFGRTTIHLLN